MACFLLNDIPSESNLCRKREASLRELTRSPARVNQNTTHEVSHMEFVCSHCQKVLQAQPSESGDEKVCGGCRKATIVPFPLSPNVIVDDYVILRELGRGGMATVFLAYQRSLDRDVALKILGKEFSNAQDDIDQFIRGARAAAGIIHPHIVQTYAVGESDGCLFLSMEHVDGRSAASLLGRSGRLSVPQAVGIVRQIAAALDYAWNLQGLVHMDVTPDNILLTTSGEAKLADMGLAKFKAELDQETLAQDEFVGTPAYVAPEVILGTNVDHRSDLYSLGCTFFHLVTGMLPFDGDGPVEVARKHLEEMVQAPSDLFPDIPKTVSTVIRKLMAKKPDERYKSGSELIRVLETIDEDGTSPALATGSTYCDPNAWACHECGGTNYMESKYCIHCGTFGFEPCPACHTNIRFGARFCPDCGCSTVARKASTRMELQELLDRITTFAEGSVADAVAACRETRDRMAGWFPQDLREEFDRRSLELKRQLEQRLYDAYRRRNIPDTEATVELLTIALAGHLGPHSEALISSYGDAKRDLKQKILLAKSALDRNCISRANELLDRLEPWQGGILGNERELCVKNCERRLHSRNRALARARMLVGRHDYVDALAALQEVSLFRIPKEIRMLKPAADDIDFEAGVVDVQERLKADLTEDLCRWMKKDDWQQVTEVAETVERVGSPESRRLLMALKSAISRESARRYRRALSLETQDEFLRAEKAWRWFLMIPNQFVSMVRLETAADFTFRRNQNWAKKMTHLTNNAFAAFVLIWVCVFGPIVVNMVELLFRDQNSVAEILTVIVLAVSQLVVVFMLERMFKWLFQMSRYAQPSLQPCHCQS